MLVQLGNYLVNFQSYLPLAGAHPLADVDK
jgi:hypothetical protein